jgi:GntR family transcriptional repressor for pyruvate dehydrogenase complex
MARRTSALPEKVANALLQRIMSEEFPAGAPLPTERELQEQYQVSRPVVREAIKWLESRGLISTRSGYGAVIGSDLTGAATNAVLLAFHRSNVCTEDILRTRELLEPEIAALAAQQATPPQMRQLKTLSRALDGITFGGDEEKHKQQTELWTSTDARFHVLLAEATQNPVMSVLINVLVGILWMQRQANGYELSPDQRANAIRQHKALADAVAERNSAAARAMMTEHLASTYNHLAGLENGLKGAIDLMIDPFPARP